MPKPTPAARWAEHPDRACPGDAIAEFSDEKGVWGDVLYLGPHHYLWRVFDEPGAKSVAVSGRSRHLDDAQAAASAVGQAVWRAEVPYRLADEDWAASPHDLKWSRAERGIAAYILDGGHPRNALPLAWEGKTHPEVYGLLKEAGADPALVALVRWALEDREPEPAPKPAPAPTTELRWENNWLAPPSEDHWDHLHAWAFCCSGRYTLFTNGGGKTDTGTGSKEDAVAALRADPNCRPFVVVP